MASGSDLLLLSVRTAFCACSHDAGAVRCLPSQCGGRGVDGGCLLLRLLVLQPRSRHRHRPLGVRKPFCPLALILTGIGAFLFSTGNLAAANIGRILQGSGGAFALVGAIYIASNNFPSSRAATLTGAAQMFGMAGGSAGQIVVGPLIASGLSWNQFWIAMDCDRHPDRSRSLFSASRT